MVRERAAPPNMNGVQKIATKKYGKKAQAMAEASFPLVDEGKKQGKLF